MLKKDCLLISMFSKNESSYAKYYIDTLKKKNKTYDIIYFERYDLNAEAEENEILFKHFCPTGGSKIKKISVMMKYALFIRRYLKDKYGCAIILTTIPGIFTCDLLIRNYKNRYLIDIRDYTHEKNKLFYCVLKKIIKNAYATVISSRGFKQFLPREYSYIVTHNISHNYKQKEHARCLKKGKCTIGFVGSIRYYEENMKLINQLKNNDDFQLVYWGSSTQGFNLEEYSKENNVYNIEFHGKYNNDDKDSIYQNIDIINSIYGVKGLETILAIPNRLYDAAIYRCPIIVSKGTYLAKVVEGLHMGIAVDIHQDDVVKILRAYIDSFNVEQFENGCYKLLAMVEKDMENFMQTISDFIDSIDR